MVELLIGAAVGAGCMIVKDQVVSEKPKSDELTRQLNELSDENEKLRKRNKEAERQVDDLQALVQKLQRQIKASDADNDDAEDELDELKAKVKKLTDQKWQPPTEDRRL